MLIYDFQVEVIPEWLCDFELGNFAAEVLGAEVFSEPDSAGAQQGRHFPHVLLDELVHVLRGVRIQGSVQHGILLQSVPGCDEEHACGLAVPVQETCQRGPRAGVQVRGKSVVRAYRRVLEFRMEGTLGEVDAIMGCAPSLDDHVY